MEIWHISINPTFAPPEIKNMPGRSSKVRRKEAAKTKKFEKLPRIGLAMTCSNCNGRGHNKRGCPQSLESSAKEEPSNSGRERGKTSSSGRGIGRPKKPTRDEGEKRKTEKRNCST